MGVVLGLGLYGLGFHGFQGLGLLGFVFASRDSKNARPARQSHESAGLRSLGWFSRLRAYGC